jgi:AcrR family transcriptional regulator
LDFRIQAVMDRAQVSTTVIYNMFATRDELVEHAAVRLAAENKAVARSVLSDAASASQPAGFGTEREQAVAALQLIFEHVRSSEKHRVLLGLTSLVSGRRIDSDEQFARRKHDYFGAVTQVFAAQLNVLGDLDTKDYVEVGPLGFFMMVIFVNFPDGLGADIDLAPAFLRVVESTIQLSW